MREGVERVPEKDQKIDVPLGNPRPDLLVSPQRSARKLVDLDTKFVLQLFAG